MSDILSRVQAVRDVVEDDTEEAVSLLDALIADLSGGGVQPMSGGGGNTPPIKN